MLSAADLGFCRAQRSAAVPWLARGMSWAAAERASMLIALFLSGQMPQLMT
jgi:hypothetical protein